MTQELISLTVSDLYFHHTISEYSNEEYALHCHPYYEIFYFRHGDVKYQIEGVEYILTSGMLLLMPPGAFHGVRILTNRPYDRIAIHFLPSFLSEKSTSILLSPFHIHGACLSFLEKYHIEEYLDSLLCCASMPEPLKNAALPPRLESLLSQICLMSQCITIGETVDLTVRRVIDYLTEHLSETTTLDDLASRFFISKNQLNRLFRKATGTTVMSYLSHKRIAAAQQLLLSGTSASDAALQTGFGDYSNFYRTYRRLSGHSPIETQRLNIL